MFKHFFVTISFLIFINFHAHAENIAIVDVNFLINNSKAGKFIQKNLTADNKKIVEDLKKKETNLINRFKRRGYIISKVESIDSLNYIKNLTKRNLKKILSLKKGISRLNLNNLHEIITLEKLNDIRVNLINLNNKDENFKYHYFKIAKNLIYTLVGNELMMQKSGINHN